jgi:hypothetical protein
MEFLIGVILVALALFSVVGVMYFVLTEKMEHEEYFIPPPASEPSDSASENQA